MAKTSHAVSSPSESHGFAVGMTGGIGSGKTAVSDLFAKLGAAIIDSDAIAHALTAPNGAAIEEIAREFGAHYINAEGAMDREQMRDRVFRDPSAKARLEAILHPRIREQTLAEAAAAADRAPYVMFVIPLLIESGSWRGRVDRLLLIDCSPTTQEARVCARSRLDPALARSIIAQQASRAERLDAADDVLVNEGPRAYLFPRVRRLHHCYCEHARRTSGRV